MDYGINFKDEECVGVKGGDMGEAGGRKGEGGSGAIIF